MILGFKQYFDSKKTQPTNFREKILAGANDRTTKFVPKIHTLRADPHDRWKSGMSIQMVYRGAGYKILDHFNKVIPELEKCVSTQRIHIKHYKDGGIHISIDHKMFFYGKIINGNVKPDNDLYNRNIFMLSKNDGFESTEHFFQWFKKDFTGKIIHFSNFRY